MPLSQFPTEISLREVGPRDGLQNEPPIPTAAKIALINALSETGVRRIEVTSFMRPSVLPQLADAAEVVAGITRAEDVRYSALIPNLRGAERALASGLTELEVVVSASQTHNLANLNRTTEASLVEIATLIPHVKAAGGSIEVIVATAFGCPYEGDISPERVASIAARVIAAGADRLAFGDTTGMATPRRVAEVIDAVRGRVPSAPVLLHFHNTRGTALANVLTAMELGITEFDASVGGLGGCPFAPGASGNVASEELVHMLEDMNIATGVDLIKLLKAAQLAQSFMGHELTSGVLRAGPRSRRYTSEDGPKTVGLGT